MKKAFLIGIVLSICCLLSACGCKHEWKDATCTTPKTCTLCGKTEGEPIEHNWQAATCTEPERCADCDATQGSAIEHTWDDATCTVPKTCSVCGTTEGEALGHSPVEATCTEDGTCTACGEILEKAKGHTVDEWIVAKEASCFETGIENGICTICGAEETREIDKTEHNPGDWKITKEANLKEDGERTRDCTVCGEKLESETYSLSADEREEYFKSQCKTFTYKEIARNPQNYEGEYAKFKGEVVQVIEGDVYDILRVNVTKGRYYWEDTIYVIYYPVNDDGSRILEDDIITMYGTLEGTKTYETVMGASVTLPLMYVYYITLH